MTPITCEIARKLKKGTKLIVICDRSGFNLNQIITIGGKYYDVDRDYDIDSGKFVPTEEDDNGHFSHYFALYLDIDKAIKNVYTAIRKAKKK